MWEHLHTAGHWLTHNVPTYITQHTKDPVTNWISRPLTTFFSPSISEWISRTFFDNAVAHGVRILGNHFNCYSRPYILMQRIFGNHFNCFSRIHIYSQISSIGLAWTARGLGWIGSNNAMLGTALAAENIFTHYLPSIERWWYRSRRTCQQIENTVKKFDLIATNMIYGGELGWLSGGSSGANIQAGLVGLLAGAIIGYFVSRERINETMNVSVRFPPNMSTI